MLRPIALCLVTACASSTIAEKPGPRGLHADQHLAIASREDARASELASWPEQRPGPIDGTTAMLATRSWFGTWDTVAEHQRQALHHRSDAAALEAEYEQACGDTPHESLSISPLQRYGVGGSAAPDGMVVLLTADAGPPDKLLAAMRCHRAWMMLGHAGMEDCPLDLPGIRVSARGDANGIELTITVADPALVPELRRRASLDLEAGRTLH
jgi:hypothetical protein